MTDEVILGLDHQMVLVEDVDRQNRVAFELLRREKTSQCHFFSGEVIDTDLTK